MITSKQRAFLRAYGTKVQTSFQMGKDGISDNLLNTLSDGLEANEIVKIHILENCAYSPKEALVELAEKTGAEQVTAIGNKVILYKESKKKKDLSLKVKSIK